MIYLIECLWIDMMENELGAAIGYRAAGYVDTEEDAKTLCDRAGLQDGDGWPIRKGEQRPKLRYRAVPRLRSVPDLSHLVVTYPGRTP